MQKGLRHPPEESSNDIFSCWNGRLLVEHQCTLNNYLLNQQFLQEHIQATKSYANCVIGVSKKHGTLWHCQTWNLIPYHPVLIAQSSSQIDSSHEHVRSKRPTYSSISSSVFQSLEVCPKYKPCLDASNIVKSRTTLVLTISLLRLSQPNTNLAA